MGAVFGGGGGGGGGVYQTQAPVYTPDPALEQARLDAMKRADATAEIASDRSSGATLGKYMGTQGARALFTGTAAGYGKTLGNANTGTG